jgi:tRNA (guanine10-N2)-dimethyltransferase
MENNLFLIEKSRENSSAFLNELESVKSTFHDFEIVEDNPYFCLITGNPVHIGICAFVNRVSRVLMVADEPGKFRGFELPAGKFFVRFWDSGKCHDQTVEPFLGDLLNGKGRVSFKDPDFLVRIIHSGAWYLCLVQYERPVREFEMRRAPMRPFFSPVSLHPKYARFLVNLTRVPTGGLVIDPFCGTGGILIEASLTGRKSVGNDASLNMVLGSRLNLKYMKIRNSRIIHGDFFKLGPDGSYDGIATDLPYGRSAEIANYGIEELYEKAFIKFHDLLKNDAYCAVVISDTGMLKYSEGLFKIVNRTAVRQHKSLTRHFISLRRLK